jgi:predicted CXXCH cytochrome family protein
MNNLKIIVAVIGGLFLVSCESTTIQDISGVVTNPTYNAHIKPIMTSKCTSCHSSNGTSPSLVTYLEVKEASENGDLLCRLDATCGNIMPQSGRLPQATIDMINKWATNNFPEN